MIQSKFKCPCCQRPLTVEIQGLAWYLFCGHGPCKSSVANDGALGDTEKAAADRLEALMEAAGEIPEVGEKGTLW